MQTVNERTAMTFRSSVRGDDGSIVTPATVKYRVDCLTNNQPIVAWTNLTPASIQTIEVLGAANAIQDDNNGYEDRQLTVMTDEGLSSQQVSLHQWRVRNVYGTP